MSLVEKVKDVPLSIPCKELVDVLSQPAWVNGNTMKQCVLYMANLQVPPYHLTSCSAMLNLRDMTI